MPFPWQEDASIDLPLSELFAAVELLELGTPAHMFSQPHNECRPFKGLDIRISIRIRMKGREFINLGSELVHKHGRSIQTSHGMPILPQTPYRIPKMEPLKIPELQQCSGGFIWEGSILWIL